MKTFKKGDRFIPRKPKNTSQYPNWSMNMDKFNGRVLTFDKMDYDGNLTSKDAEFYSFHPDWCKKVEENSVNFVQREGDTISIEAPLSTSATATLGDVKKPFLIVTTNHHEGIKYEEGTAKSPYIPLMPLSPNHIPDVGKTIDWEQRKYELAKEFMAAQISGCIAGNISWNHKDCIRDAFIYVDDMIKKLKSN